MSYVLLEKLGFEVGNRHIAIDVVDESVELEGQFSRYELECLVCLLHSLDCGLSDWNHEQVVTDAKD